MANPIIIFWKWFNPFSTADDGEKKWDNKKKKALLKLTVICSLLIPVVIFYIKCNEVSVLFTEISSTNLNGTIPVNTKISVCYDFSRTQDAFVNQGPGVYVQLEVPDIEKANRPKPVFSEENLDKLKRYKAGDTFGIFWPYADELLSLYELLYKDIKNGKINMDSICNVYKIHIENRAILPFQPIVFDHTSKEIKTGTAGHEGYMSAVMLSIPPITRNDTIKADGYYLCDGNNYYKNIFKLSGSSFRYYSNIFFDARDISRSVEVFGITGDLNMAELEYIFLGSTEFSAIHPSPDEISYNSIKYINPEKLAIIAERGLIFHTKYPDMENKQQARMFATTTLLTLLITLFFKYLYVVTADLGRHLYENYPRLFRYCFVTIIALPVLYLIFSLCFQIML